ncbi:short-chain dehydrogenase/reductase family protein [Apodospora peruviana]|uniref:Short-chain dehydrogenase/reductase family protein n=1 Tax=Apodospora peruviana TaxID=516989 RepID=A0AAE0IJB1_9PEZI|nr:short-chain dehydrogenase/reductase family protein [Apodospora peruviana]
MIGSKDLPPAHESFSTVFIRNQFRTSLQLPPKSTNLSSHVAIVTGANTGLGYEAASQLLSYGLGHLILAVRSLSKGEAAAAKLRAQHSSPQKGKIEVWQLDMSSYPSIQQFASRVNTDLARLDIAILNAGVMNTKYHVNPSTNHEETMQVNYLSTVLLCILLLPALKTKSPPGAPGRLTIVSATLSLTPKFANRAARPLLKSFDEAAKEKWKGVEQYCCSKLLAHMFLWKLVEYVKADDVIVNLADPAWVRGTNLAAQDIPAVGRAAFALFYPLLMMVARSPRMGASTFLDAVITKGKESHGAFLTSYKIYPFNDMLYTPEGVDVIETLWKETLDDELAFADVRGILERLSK